MSELRKDPVVNRWVIIANERGVPPALLASAPEEPALSAGCPFCETNERMTPREVLALRDSGEPDQSGWYVRVVPHKFPVLRIEGEPELQDRGVRVRMNGIGAHEIVIENPRHTIDLAFAPVEQIMRVIGACLSRVGDLRRDTRFQYITVFRNHRREAGATLEHPHSQIVALPTVPGQVVEQLAGSHDYYRDTGRCVYCDVIADEMACAERIVLRTESFVVVCPYASPSPYCTLILPLQHSADPAGMSTAAQADLAAVLQRLLIAYRAALANPPYNLVYHTAPTQAPTGTPYAESLPEHFHWHIAITPRLTGLTGAEWGAGFPVNPVAPEDAAAELARSLP